jgi:predicted nucleic acid-binding protein
MAITLFGKQVNTDPRYFLNFLDANALDLTDSPEDAAIEEILRLAEAGDFELYLPYSVKDEIAHPNTPAEIKRKAQSLPFSEPVQLTEPERAKHRKIATLLQGNAKEGQHAKDAFHVVESSKYGKHFITNDKRLLKNAPAIWQELQIRILKPSEFIADYYPNKETA